jgi:hypothetical protein
MLTTVIELDPDDIPEANGGCYKDEKSLALQCTKVT